MKLIIDESITFAEEAFSQFGEIKLLHGRRIDNQVLKDADILISEAVYTENLIQKAEQYKHMTAKEAALIARLRK